MVFNYSKDALAEAHAACEASRQGEEGGVCVCGCVGVCQRVCGGMQQSVADGPLPSEWQRGLAHDDTRDGLLNARCLDSNLRNNGYPFNAGIVGLSRKKTFGFD